MPHEIKLPKETLESIKDPKNKNFSSQDKIHVETKQERLKRKSGVKI